MYIKGDAVVVMNNGKSQTLPEDEFSIEGDDGMGVRFLGIGEEAAATYGIKNGVYLFDKSGRQISLIPVEAPESCARVLFSPSNKLIAVDQGTSVIRAWVFFSYPDLKPMGQADYIDLDEPSSLSWNGDKGMLFSTLDPIDTIDTSDTSRTCGYDPCAPISASYYTFSDQKVKPVLAGTTECDYRFQQLDSNTLDVTVIKRCAASGKAWETLPEDSPTETITVKLQ